MRKAILTLVAVTLGVALVVGTAGAKPPGDGGTAVSAPVTGTFTPSLGAETIPFTGTLTVDRFTEADGQLVLEGELAADPAGPSEPLALTVVAVASASFDEATGGCTVVVGTASTLVQRDFLLFLEGTTFQLGDSGSSQDLCRVVRAVDRDPADQGAIARALNKALGMS
jgi:hypothetical protein